MQQDFETTALEIYQPFIHKQARSYFRKYASCTRYGAIDYEEFSRALHQACRPGI